MTTTNNEVTVASVLSSALRPVRSQLDLALSQSAGTLHASVESALSLTDQVETLELEQADKEVEEFNVLYDTYTALNETFTTQGLRIASLEELLEEQRVLVSEANARAETMNARLKVTTADSRMFWFKRDDPRAVFVDIRSLSDTLCDGRHLEIRPDLVADFRDLPFADASFQVVVFDPPHLTHCGPNGWQGKKYGILTKSWRDDLTKGFAEAFRV